MTFFNFLRFLGGFLYGVSSFMIDPQSVFNPPLVAAYLQNCLQILPLKNNTIDLEKTKTLAVNFSLHYY